MAIVDFTKAKCNYVSNYVSMKAQETGSFEKSNTYPSQPGTVTTLIKDLQWDTTKEEETLKDLVKYKRWNVTF